MWTVLDVCGREVTENSIVYYADSEGNLREARVTGIGFDIIQMMTKSNSYVEIFFKPSTCKKPPQCTGVIRI